ncbi:hypothetical protein DPMN_031811 [Dreissena polymorpha]|uniref:Uncharacterized protein n=1 Tax=Dreissena polymorpha TaxID=45954 RepID=A0A9D4M2K4_DREPO|nr:hypothetical protein DPMN_031811 [Dreissena polymorpha]
MCTYVAVRETSVISLYTMISLPVCVHVRVYSSSIEVVRSAEYRTRNLAVYEVS